jgi:hypothetical protein
VRVGYRDLVGSAVIFITSIAALAVDLNTQITEQARVLGQLLHGSPA